MGNRQSLLTELKQYKAYDEREDTAVKRTITFLEEEPRAFERECLRGHLTASAYVVDESGRYLLLTHHIKADKWLQLGGHCDGDEDVLEVAKREVFEEAGLDKCWVEGSIFDVDIHQIPEYKGVPPHVHYDIRYVFTTNKSSKLLRQETESRELKWVPIDELEKFWKDSYKIGRIRTKLYSKIGNNLN